VFEVFSAQTNFEQVERVAEYVGSEVEVGASGQERVLGEDDVGLGRGGNTRLAKREAQLAVGGVAAIVVLEFARGHADGAQNVLGAGLVWVGGGTQIAQMGCNEGTNLAKIQCNRSG
jgi:hypothetical protein